MCSKTLLIAALLLGQVYRSDDPIAVDRDNRAVPPVARRKINDYYDFLENTFLKVGERTSRPAMNTNTLGGVPDSSWFTNRIGAVPISREELVRGANLGEGPAPGRLTVIGGKSQGVTPGFTVKDAIGDTYFLKFDPAANPQLATAAEMISSRFFHALGYNVPEYYLITFRPADLQISPDATIRNELDEKIPLTIRYVERLLSSVARNEDGRIRAIASKLIPGANIGPFRFYGTRTDDPNDVFPHEHRRELRGYYVFCSWLNHDDSRSVNTVDFYVGEKGQGSVKHYLIDFGSTLGSGSLMAQKRRPGNEYMFEAGPTFGRMLSLGLWLPGWVSVKYPDFPSIGRFESDFYQPNRWKPEYPNPAFRNMDPEDAFWAARLVMMFRDDDIRSIVPAGMLSDKQAEEYLIQTLIKRRDKVGNYYLRQVSSLDNFHIEGGGLVFDDLLVKYGFEKEMKEQTVRITAFDNRSGARTELAPAPPVRQGRMMLPPAIANAADSSFQAVTLAAGAHSVDVVLRKSGPSVRIVGIQRK